MTNNFVVGGFLLALIGVLGMIAIGMNHYTRSIWNILFPVIALIGILVLVIGTFRS